jgi:hypothetical protein
VGGALEAHLEVRVKAVGDWSDWISRGDGCYSLAIDTDFPQSPNHRTTTIITVHILTLMDGNSEALK